MLEGMSIDIWISSWFFECLLHWMYHLCQSHSGRQGGATGSDTVPGSAKCSLVRIQMVGHVRAGKKKKSCPTCLTTASMEERKREREREREHCLCLTHSSWQVSFESRHSWARSVERINNVNYGDDLNYSHDLLETLGHWWKMLMSQSINTSQQTWQLPF